MGHTPVVLLTWTSWVEGPERQMNLINISGIIIETGLLICEMGLDGAFLGCSEVQRENPPGTKVSARHTVDTALKTATVRAGSRPGPAPNQLGWLCLL